jgi:excisionase family DNA binding protein
MRATHARTLADRAGDPLLTTGEAARLLGVSRQHIVDLCEAGDLPHALVGKHRRIYRSDVEAVRTGRSRMNKQDTQSLLLAYAVAAEIVNDPTTAIAKAQSNLTAMMEAPHKGATRVWLSEWEKLLDGPVVDLLQALTATTQRSHELRQNSPFAGVISEETRRNALRLARVGHAPA